MALTSSILAGSPRLDQAAAGGPSVKPGLPADDVDAVQRIQRALVTLGQPLPISFPNGPANDPDGIFGDETYRAVLTFQKKVFPSEPEQWDGRVGKNTLAKMDGLLPKGATPPAPPGPPGPSPLLSRTAAEQAIRAYLSREMRRDVVSILVDHPANLIAFGEVHNAGDAFKAFLLQELVRVVKVRRPAITHFHASERFPNEPVTRSIISEFLNASPFTQVDLLRKFPPALQLLPFVPVLVQAANFPNRRYGILPIDRAPGKDEDGRHGALFESFIDSAARCPDVPSGSINSRTSRGNVLLGARHAARRSVLGHTTKTTCARLVDDGWTVLAARLTVPPDPTGKETPESLSMVLRRGAADHTPIDVLQIAQSIAAGKPFFADLTKSDSPFTELRENEADAADIAFNQLFDALVHLS
jgi:hypothetical protein